LADDDVDDRILFKDAIEQIKQNVSLKLVANGKELMEYLSDESNPLPDFIFLDLCMPDKNGFQCLEEIRSNDRFKNLCVIIYSFSSQLEDIQMSLNKGANLYFSKSSTFQELVNRLRRVFNMNWDEFMSKTTIEKFVLVDDVAF
jgi:DNA-binding response OmpR family regulator